MHVLGYIYRKDLYMTTLLKKAFSEASKLSELEQNSVARWLLEELDSDRRWDQQFSESEDVLGKLAKEALEEYDCAGTSNLDPDRL